MPFVKSRTTVSDVVVIELYTDRSFKLYALVLHKKNHNFKLIVFRHILLPKQGNLVPDLPTAVAELLCFFWNIILF